MTTDTFDVWSLKYLFTKGIVLETGVMLQDGVGGDKGRAFVSRDIQHISTGDYVFLELGKEAFRNYHEAQAAAVKKVEKRIKSLETQTEKMRQLLASLK